MENQHEAFTASLHFGFMSVCMVEITISGIKNTFMMTAGYSIYSEVTAEHPYLEPKRSEWRIQTSTKSCSSDQWRHE